MGRCRATEQHVFAICMEGVGLAVKPPDAIKSATRIVLMLAPDGSQRLVALDEGNQSFLFRIRTICLGTSGAGAAKSAKIGRAKPISKPVPKS